MLFPKKDFRSFAIKKNIVTIKLKPIKISIKQQEPSNKGERGILGSIEKHSLNIFLEQRIQRVQWNVFSGKPCFIITNSLF